MNYYYIMEFADGGLFRVRYPVNGDSKPRINRTVLYCANTIYDEQGIEFLKTPLPFKTVPNICLPDIEQIKEADLIDKGYVLPYKRYGHAFLLPCLKWNSRIREFRASGKKLFFERLHEEMQ